MHEEVEIARGRQAQQLKENTLLIEALEAIKQRYRDSIESSSLSSRDLREEAYRMLCAVKVLEQHLTSFVTTGKLATTAQAQREEMEVRGRDIAEWDGSPDGLTGLGNT